MSPQLLTPAQRDLPKFLTETERFEYIKRHRAQNAEARKAQKKEPVTFMCPACTGPVYKTTVHKFLHNEATERTLAMQAQRRHVCP